MTTKEINDNKEKLEFCEQNNISIGLLTLRYPCVIIVKQFLVR